VNQPKFSSCATWNPYAITLTNISTVGLLPYRLFVSTNNALYVAATNRSQLLMWSEGSNTVTRSIFGGLNNPFGVFVTSNGDIYVDNGATNHRVDKWAWNATSSVVVMNVTNRCMDLFIANNDTLYCSIDIEHKVVKVSLNSSSNVAIITAGNGIPGSGPYMLNWPNGIFVDMKFNLYVSDYLNDRIQLFQPNQLNAITVAGTGEPGTITLNGPVDVILDADGYLFIVDLINNRIVGSGPNGFRCLVGCTGSGSASNELNIPHCVRFDSYGNLFVDDQYNNRIQKFLFNNNSCGKFYTNKNHQAFFLEIIGKMSCFYFNSKVLIEQSKSFTMSLFACFNFLNILMFDIL
jgi:hypothetical protein